jgi:hypothetical protein
LALPGGKLFILLPWKKRTKETCFCMEYSARCGERQALPLETANFWEKFDPNFDDVTEALAL